MPIPKSSPTDPNRRWPDITKQECLISSTSRSMDARSTCLIQVGQTVLRTCPSLKKQAITGRADTPVAPAVKERTQARRPDDTAAQRTAAHAVQGRWKGSANMVRAQGSSAAATLQRTMEEPRPSKRVVTRADGPSMKPPFRSCRGTALWYASRGTVPQSGSGIRRNSAVMLLLARVVLQHQQGWGTRMHLALDLGCYSEE